MGTNKKDFEQWHTTTAEAQDTAPRTTTRSRSTRQQLTTLRGLRQLLRGMEDRTGAAYGRASGKS